MKRSCYTGKIGQCRALRWDCDPPFCLLGYPLETDWDAKMLLHRMPRPKVECPKPRTNSEFLAAQPYQKEQER